MKEKVLVTGGNGFVGLHCILELLSRGYHVVTTVRSAKKRQTIDAAVEEAGLVSPNTLDVFEADLLSDRNWARAASGCHYALHVASPISLHLPQEEQFVVKPAVEGTLRVLRAAQEAGVKRVVMTSNFGAVGYSHSDTTKLITEESWTDPDQKGLSLYNRSKVLAEKAAWEFINSPDHSLELAVVNPTAILGPALNSQLSSGAELLQQVLNGSMKLLPRIRLAIVDVRDVVDLHLRAMLAPEAKGQRFLALAGGTLSLAEIVELVRRSRPEAATRASSKVLPTALLRMAALFSKKARAVLPLVDVYREASNEKAMQLLGWQPRSNEEAVLATVQSLLDYGHLQPV